MTCPGRSSFERVFGSLCAIKGPLTHGQVARRSMSSPVYLPDPRKPRRPSRRALAIAGVVAAVSVGSIVVWLEETQRAPVAPKTTPVPPPPPPVQAPAESAQPALGSIGPLSPERERALKPLESFRDCAKDCPEMIVIPAGAFTMGTPPAETGRFDNEGPPRQVTIARPFAVSRFDVTFADWDACVAAGGCPAIGDAGFGRGTKPVINVTWNDARQYVAWLSKTAGRPYRLLTEAEWEYAARAGATTAYPWGEEVGEGNANCNGCGGAWDNRADVAGRIVQAQCIRPLRHGRQRVAMGRGLLSWRLPRRARRRFGVDRRRLQPPCRPRRFLGRPAAILPLRPPAEFLRRVPDQQSRLPGRENARALNACSLNLSVRGAGGVSSFGAARIRRRSIKPSEMQGGNPCWSEARPLRLLWRWSPR